MSRIDQLVETQLLQAQALEALATVIDGGVTMMLSTVSVIKTTQVSASVTGITVLGFSSVGDGGNGLYYRVSTNPSPSFGVQSADGAWWELQSPLQVQGLEFGTVSGNIPISTTATLIGGDGTAHTIANFIDISNFTVATSILNHPKFSVSGTGIVLAGYSSSLMGAQGEFVGNTNLVTNFGILGYGGFANFVEFAVTANASANGQTIKNSNQNVLSFHASDGTQLQNNARIIIASDGTQTTGAVPANMQFLTAISTTSVERMRIDSLGNVVVNTQAISSAATTGFLYIPTCAGTATGTPTSYSGRAPIVYDTTNNFLWIYNGSWRHAAFT